jgi:hypothetical protein
MDSILTSIKKMLGIDEEYTQFDMDIIILINNSLNTLNQLGVGVEGFSISSKKDNWEDFLGGFSKYVGMVQTYIYVKVKLAFDSTSMSGSVLEAYKEMARESEWRMCTQVDLMKKEG